MRLEQCDYIVVGYSLAGISAALTLAEGGERVVVVDFHRDTDAIEDPAMHDKLKRAGVERQTACFVERVASGVVECSDVRWSAKGVVFAPNGTEPGIDVPGSAALQGFGLSYSAAADAPYFQSRRVAVYGDAPRVHEQASIAAQYASDVVVLKKEDGVVLRSLIAGTDGMLTAVEYEDANGRRSIDVPALFVAQHLVPVTDVVVPGDGVAVAGLATGIDYWKREELVDDGVRAARALLTVRQ